MSPNRNPSRMPCFTHVFTRQPLGLERSDSAARTVPAESASRSDAKMARAASRSAEAPAATSASICVWSVIETCVPAPLDQRGFQQAELAQHLDDFLLRFGARRAHRQPVRLLEK